MAEECGDAPVCCNPRPALEMRLRARAGRLLEFVLDDDVLRLVGGRPAAGGGVVVIEGEFLGAEVRPVEVLGFDERDDEGVRERAER